MIYVIADDLTGANDTGVQFAKHGYNTQVLIPDQEFNYLEINEEKFDVLVIDTETRNISEKKSRKKLKKLVNLLDISKHDIIYKKIDSTLRGNIGAEVEEIMNELNKKICVFTPSFPKNNRITIDSYLFVNETSSIIIKKENFNEIKDAMKDENLYIPSILKKQTNYEIGLLKLKDIRRGKDYILSQIDRFNRENKKIIIVDSSKDKHLKDVVESSIRLGDSVLYAGSAGLASQLSQYLRENLDHEKDFFGNHLSDESSFLIVGGTRKKTLFTQINYLKEKANLDLNIINIDVNKLVKGERTRKQYLDKLSRFQISKYQHIVIRPDPVFNDQKKIKEILNKNNITFRELELLIRDFLGGLTKKIVARYTINNIIVTGGDTALGICNNLGTQNLNVVDELLPGIPLNIIKIFSGKKINLITKAGDFGSEETLYEIITKI